MALLSLFRDIVSDTNETILFVEKRCLRRRLNICECTLCIDSCPKDSLSLDGRNIRLDVEKCTRCARCIAVCPNDAFDLAGNDLSPDLDSVSDNDLSVITCSRQSRMQPREKVVPCMGIFSIELLFTIGVTGPSVAAFNLTGCSECENKDAAEAFLQSLTHIQLHASLALNTAFKILTKPDQVTSLKLDGRRAYLSGLSTNIVSAARSYAWPQKEDAVDGSLKNKRIPRKLQLLQKLLEHKDDEKTELAASLCAYQLDINSTCTLCPLCTGICPTGALKVTRLKGEKQLQFKRAICSGCGLCVSFCKPQAITLSSPLISTRIYAQTSKENLYEKREA